MLFAGFGACLVVGLVAKATPSRAARTAAVLAPTGVLLVLAGYFVSDAAELVGAAVLTVGLGCAAAATVELAGSRTARALLRVGALTIVVSTLLALWWALGEATGLRAPEPVGDGRDDGVANALGFVLCTPRGLAAPARRPERTGLTNTQGRRHPGRSAPRRLPAPAGAAPADAGRDPLRSRRGR